MSTFPKEGNRSARRKSTTLGRQLTCMVSRRINNTLLKIEPVTLELKRERFKHFATKTDSFCVNSHGYEVSLIIMFFNCHS